MVPVKLFVSWSKDTSHAVALALHEWLPYVVPSAEPWVSSEDIAKGTRGRDAIVKELAGTGQGVICLTRENVREPWINFEAGALSNHPETPRVRTVLFDLKPSDVVGPLSDFQHTELNRQEDVLKLVKSINEASDQQLAEKQFNSYFEKFWPDLVAALDKIREDRSQLPIGDDGATPRRPDQLIEEVLERVRMIDRRDGHIINVLAGLDAQLSAIAGSLGINRHDPGSKVGQFVAIPDIGVGQVKGIRDGDLIIDLVDDEKNKGTTLSMPGSVADQFEFSMSKARATSRYRSLPRTAAGPDGGIEIDLSNARPKNASQFGDDSRNKPGQ